MKCTWNLKIDDNNTIEFNTIEELENYIIKNNPEYIKYAGTKYNFEEITKSLQQLKNETEPNTDGVLNILNKIPGLVQGFDGKAYEEGFKKIALEELAKKGVNEIQRDLEVKKLWTAKEAEIKKSREVGKGIHLVIENLIGIIRNQTYVGNDSYIIAIDKTKAKIQSINEKIDKGELKEYADGIRPSLEGLDLNSLTKILDDFKVNVYNSIKSLASVDEKGNPKFWIRTEQSLTAPLGEPYANNKEFGTEKIENIKGKLDIVIVYEDKNTKALKAKVLDIKTSSLSIKEWDSDRLNTVDVQLGIYKRLLASQGIYENNIGTESIVITLDTTDTNNVVAKSLSRTLTDLDINKLQTVKKIVPLKEQILPEDKDFVDNVKQDFLGCFDVDPDTMVLNSLLDNKFKNKIIPDRIISVDKDGNKIDKTVYKVTHFDEDNNFLIKVFDLKEDAEDFIKDQIIENKNKIVDQTKRLTDIIENALERGDVNSMFRNSAEEYNSFWKRNLEKYTKVKGWRVQNSTIYNELGVIVFVNDITKELDILNVINENINTKVKISNNNNILGKFVSDSQAELRSDTIRSTIGNVELIKTMLIANRLNIPDYKIGSIKVLDKINKTGTAPIIEKDLMSNFKTLCSKNNIVNNNIQFKDKFIQALEDIIYSKRNIGSEQLHSVLKSKADEFKHIKSVNDQIEKLVELKRILTEEVDDYNQNAQNAFGDSFSGFIFREISDKIADLSGLSLDLTNNETMTNWGTKFNKSFLMGLKVNTLDTVKILEPISKLKEQTDLLIRTKYTNYKSKDNHLTHEYIKHARKQDSSYLAVNPITNFETVVFTKFYKKSEKGDLILINPDLPSESSELSEKDKEFLRAWLKDLNNHRIIASNNTITEESLKANGMYWKVPLIRSKSASRWIHNNIKNVAKGVVIDYKSQLQEINHEETSVLEKYDPREVKEFKMQNAVALSDSETQRARILEGTDPYLHFETNLEVIKDMYVQSYIIQQEWNKKLPLLNAVMVSLKTANYLYGESTNELIEYLNDYITSSVKGQSILEDEFKQAGKAIGFMRKLVTRATLGLNYKSGFKEFVISNYTLYKNAAVNSRLDKDRLSLADVNFATRFVWGDLYQQKDPDKITTAQGLNFLYGMVNNTIYESAEKQNFNAGEGFKFSNRIMVFNKFPDFTGRMTLLVGYLHKFGALDAHTIVDDWHIKYDWTKDKRFELYAKDKTGKTIPENQKEEWSRQKGNYTSRMLELINSNYEIETADGTYRVLTLNDDLPQALTTNEVSAIRQESNTMFGYMDNDQRSIYTKKMQGLLFGHFTTYLSAKKNQILLGRKKNGQGKWKQMIDQDTGLPVYRKEVLDAEGNIIDFEITTEVTDNPVYGWEGTITEGIFWSLVDLLNVTKMENLKEAWKDPYKRKNALLALEDLFAILLLLIIGNMLFGTDENASAAEKIAANLMFNTAQDINGVQALIGVAQFRVPTVDFITNMKKDVNQLLLGDIDFGYFIGNRFSVSRDFLSKD